MNVTPLVLDQAAPTPHESLPDIAAFGKALEGAGSALATADRAEDAFAARAGSLQDAMFERAEADVVLSVATAAAQRSTQAIQTILNMQI